MRRIKINLLRVLKISIGASIGCIIASLMNLNTPTSAGILAILSIQNTRRETLSLVLKRILAFFIAVIVAVLTFQIFGYQVFSIGIYLLIFAALCEIFSLQNGLVPNTVLILHLYTAKSISPALLANELLLLLTGTGCGILMNLYMPGSASTIRIQQKELEEIFRETFHRLSESIISDKSMYCDVFDLTPLYQALSRLEKKAYENHGNTLLSDSQYFIKYVEMRHNQIDVLQKLCQNLKPLASVPAQAYIISDFILEVGTKFHEYNNAEELTDSLIKIRNDMRKEPLPATREEFENRAVLYRILYDLEELIALKSRFIANLSPEEIKRFWKH